MTDLHRMPDRQAVAFVVRHDAEPVRVLVVLRPPDDAELPDVWGLPAGARRENEDWTDAVRRAGREKLGVELDVGPEIRRGTARRRHYTLEMRLFLAAIARGEPSVPQPHPEITQYRALRWADADALLPAADLGSLCCRLFLEAEAEAEG